MWVRDFLWNLTHRTMIQVLTSSVASSLLAHLSPSLDVLISFPSSLLQRQDPISFEANSAEFERIVLADGGDVKIAGFDQFHHCGYVGGDALREDFGLIQDIVEFGNEFFV